MNKIIWLNGASSAGKSSIAKALQNILPEVYLHIQADDFQNMFPSKHYMWSNEYWNIATPLFTAFHHSIKAYYDNGVNLIVDHVLLLDDWKKECSEIFKNTDLTFIRVNCELEELKSRVKKRKDRPSWLPEHQYDKVHTGFKYDFEIDTTRSTAEENANIILNTIKINYKHQGIRYEKQ